MRDQSDLRTQTVVDSLSDSPEVAKRKLRSALRQAREDAQLTQRAIAERVLWSQSKIIRIEQGNVPVAPADVRLLLLEYGVEEKRVAELVELAKSSRQPDEWAAYRDVYSSEALTLFANERAASLVEKFEPSVVPGLFQTESYARALLTALGNRPERIRRVLALRLLRQELLEHPDCPKLDFIIGEAAVSRPVGKDPRVMLEQLERLKQLAQHPKVTVRMLPFSAGAYPGLGSAFTLLQFADPDLRDLLYLEDPDKESVTRDDAESIERYSDRFVELTDLAVIDEQAVELLDEVAAYRFSR